MAGSYCISTVLFKLRKSSGTLQVAEVAKQPKLKGRTADSVYHVASSLNRQLMLVFKYLILVEKFPYFKQNF